jgi:CPA2 family monovalent cation:H+ antiporter-2
MHNVFIQDLAAILLTGGCFGWMFKKFLKLPLLLGYIFAGLLLALPISYTPSVVSTESATTLAEMGVLLLMFSMGLHFGVRKIKSLGTSPVAVSILQALSMWFIGTQVARLLGLHGYEALFLGAVISTASTAVIVKILEDHQLKSARFAEKLMGVLLVEDSIAIFMIIWLSTSVTGQDIKLFEIIPIFLCSILLWWLLGTLLLPRIIRSAFESGKEELLVILSVGLALGLAYLSASWNFSSALGAFIMGSILSECREIKKIEILIEPVKNIFALIFFVSIGFLFSPYIIIEKWKLILSLVAVVLIFKITLNFIFNLFFGRGVKDSLRMSGCMGQIGELSFVIAQVGVSLGSIEPQTFSALVATAIFTILLTPFVVKISFGVADKAESIFPKSLYKFLESYSQSVIGFSLETKMAPFYQRFSIFKGIKYLTENTKNRLRKNYLLITSKNVTATLDRLAPWDEYLVPVHVAADALITGKNLIELKIREHFSVNIVAIEREKRTIISPKATEIIMSGDTLIVYGNEESIGRLEQFCTEQILDEHESSIEECLLAGIHLSPEHPFVGKNILELGIRVNYNCIVLAVNRNRERIKNPISQFTFQKEDELFIFGTRHSLEKIKELQRIA